MLAHSLLTLAALCSSAVAQSPQWGIDNVSYALGGFQVLGVGDLNSDGREDVVAATPFPSGTSQVLLGQAGGGLSLMLGSPLGAQVNVLALAVGDLDGDAIPDLLFPNGAMKGIGNGTFGPLTFPSPPWYGIPGSAAFGSIGCAIADVNADGLNDIVIAGGDVQGFATRVNVALGVGGGAYAIPISFMFPIPPLIVGPLVVGDATGDGVQDVLFRTASGFVLVHTSASGALAATYYARGGGVAIGDVTGDLIPDIVTVAGDVLLGIGNGQFIFGAHIPGTNVFPQTVFNADGYGPQEVVLFDGTRVVLARKNGTASFDTTSQVDLQAQLNSMVVADVLGDQRKEILVQAMTAGNERLYVLRNLTPDCNANGIDDPVEAAVGLISDCDNNGVPDSCQTDCDNDGAPDVCQIAAQPSLDLNLNGALDSCEPIGNPYCFGDGTGAVCPCDPGQAGPSGGGCLNSISDGGRLRAFGNAQVSLDLATMTATGMSSGASAMLFQGTAAQAAGLGSPFGDGLLCVNGTIVRLIVRTATTTGVSYGLAASDPSLAVLGMVPGTGGTRFYQVWYRDSATYCTSFTYNLTNGVSLAWQP